MAEILQTVVAIQKHFEANFKEYPIAYENEPVTVRTAPFVRLSIRFGDSQPSLDSTFERVTGVIFVSALVPKGMGDILAWEIATKAANILKFQTIGKARCTSADFANVGVLNDYLGQDSGWFQINVNVPFWIEMHQVH